MRIKSVLPGMLAAALMLVAGSVMSAKNVFSLDGKWDVTGWSPDKSSHMELKGNVPGQIHDDLIREGKIENPFWRNNAEKCQWVENWTWVYRKSFTLPEGFSDKGTVLRFDGIDTYSEIYLNGRKIGEVGVPTTEDMFLPYEFPMEGWLLLGGRENVLEVRILPPTKQVEEKVRQKVYSTAFADKYRVYIRRMQCTFGWDWVNRFVTAGIWRSCSLVSCPDGRIGDEFYYTSSIAKNNASAEGVVSVTTDVPEGKSGVLKVKLLDPSGKTVWNGETKVSGKDTSSFSPVLKNPQLWWPNGAGEHPVYTLESDLYCDGTLADSQSKVTGIRTVTVEEIPDKTGSSFTIIMNGKRVFAKGGNWVPADPFPSRITEEKYDRLTSEMVEAGGNMLRCWGGGIFEPEAFWENCDRKGIMVWQDFLMACGGYPETDPSFVELFRKETEANVKAIRNHPSLVVWCGDNELSLNFNPSQMWPCRNMHEKVTAPMMAKLDPSRVFRLSSPLGIDPATTNSKFSGDGHLSGETDDALFTYGNYRDYRKIAGDAVRGRFLSESAVAGAPPKRTLLKFMSPDDLSKSEMFDYHTKDNPYMAGGRTLFGKEENLANGLYGTPDKDDVDRRIRQLEYVQYDFIRLSLESVRANKFYSSGIMFWMYNDCWPASGWSMVDWWGNRKASWYAFASGCRTLLASTQQTGEELRWAVSNDDIFNDLSFEYSVRVQDLSSSSSKVLKDGKMKVEANSVKEVLNMPVSKAAKLADAGKMIVFELKRDGKVVDRSCWTSLLPSELKYPVVNLKSEVKGLGSKSGSVTVSADKWARVVTLDAEADFEDNYFELLPGESRTLKWTSREPVASIGVSAWNSK